MQRARQLGIRVLVTLRLACILYSWLGLVIVGGQHDEPSSITTNDIGLSTSPRVHRTDTTIRVHSDLVLIPRSSKAMRHRRLLIDHTDEGSLLHALTFRVVFEDSRAGTNNESIGEAGESPTTTKAWRKNGGVLLVGQEPPSKLSSSAEPPDKSRSSLDTSAHVRGPALSWCAWPLRSWAPASLHSASALYEADVCS
jgi:hypothetical protein